MSIGPVPWRRALVASSVTTSSASSACSLSPHVARVLPTNSRELPSSAGSSESLQVTQDWPVRAGGIQCSSSWSCRPPVPNVLWPSSHRPSCTIPGAPIYCSRSSSGSVHRRVDRRLNGCVDALATTCCAAGTERKLGAGHCELTASPGGRVAGDNRGRQMARQASAAPTAGRGSEGRISGYVLKVIRESIGQTQEQLAERLGVSAATIQGWESGRRPLMGVSTGEPHGATRRTPPVRRCSGSAGCLDTRTGSGSLCRRRPCHFA